MSQNKAQYSTPASSLYNELGTIHELCMEAGKATVDLEVNLSNVLTPEATEPEIVSPTEKFELSPSMERATNIKRDLRHLINKINAITNRLQV